MKLERVLLTAVVLASFACHGSDSKAVRKDQQYDVVQEGDASGASSTISAPGEAPPVAGAPLTGTGADTTTNFNSTPGMMSTAGTSAASLAGTLPPPMPGGSTAAPRDPNARTLRPMTSSSTVIPTPPLPRRIAPPATQPKQRPEMPPPTTTADDQTTTSSDTAESTPTSTQPPPEKKKSDEKSEKTDTTSTEPPPPPPPPPVR